MASLEQMFRQYKKDALKAAHDLNYNYDVIKKLNAAKTESEIEYIMRNARKEKFG